MINASVTSAVIIIDDFSVGDDPQEVSSILDPGPTNFEAPTAIGGSRTLEILNFPTDADPLSDRSVLEVTPLLGGTLGHSQEVGTNGRSVVAWDADGDGLGGIDLTDSGDDAIMFEILTIDVGAVEILLTVQSTGGDIASFLSSDLMEAVEIIPYEDFTGFAPSIFTDVDLISMEIIADNGVVGTSDLLLDLVGTTNSDR